MGMTRNGSDDGAVPERAIRVYLVDDHGVVRKGMRAYLDMLPDVDVVGEAPDGAAALDGIGELVSAGQPPDVVMMDLLMPEMDGITTTALVKERHPDVEVVALTSFVAQDKVHDALAAGAAGYLLKDAEADDVGGPRLHGQGVGHGRPPSWERRCTSVSPDG